MLQGAQCPGGRDAYAPEPDGFSPARLLKLGRAELAAYPSVEVGPASTTSRSGSFPESPFHLTRIRRRAPIWTAIWPELREPAANCGAEAGMSVADMEKASELLTPDSSRYVLNEPGFSVVHPMILVTGRRPRA
jgi:hypothetical protein